MYKKIKLPFSEINLRNCQDKQYEFLASYFFDAHFNTQNFFTIDVSFEKVLLPEQYRKVEKDTYTDSNNLYLSDTKGRLCHLDTFIGKTVTITCDADFDLYYLFSFILEPLLIVNLINHGVLFLHSSAVTKNDQAMLFPAWRNTGKTDTILKLSTKKEYTFMSDDYVVVHKDTAYSFPKKINLFSYNLNDVLMKKLPTKEVARLKIFMMIKQGLEKLSLAIPHKTIAKVFFRVSELAEIATNFKISPQDIAMDFTPSAPIGEIHLIQKANYSFKENRNEKLVSQLLTTVIEYELNDFFKLTAKQFFSSHTELFNKDEFLKKYQNKLEQLLKSKKFLIKSA